MSKAKPGFDVTVKRTIATIQHGTGMYLTSDEKSSQRNYLTPVQAAFLAIGSHGEPGDYEFVIPESYEGLGDYGLKASIHVDMENVPNDQPYSKSGGVESPLPDWMEPVEED